MHSINTYTKQSDNIKQIIFDLEKTLSDVKSDIAKDLDTFSVKIDTLRRLFQEVLENAIFIEEDTENAYFEISKEIKIKKDQYPFKIKIEIPKAEALGQTRLKIIAYDLMVFLYNIRQNRDLPNFLVHDGVFHGISRRTMINTINYVFHQFNKYQNFQYILTFNEDEIISPENKFDTYGNFEFDWTQNVIAEYSDVKEKMIFKRVIS
ncbi:MAG: DUF2326 domain-containing protein [Bacteroidia bacterium]|nr:DUF2326 domain-containing protein [Bacteroidia bacterium]